MKLCEICLVGPVGANGILCAVCQNKFVGRVKERPCLGYTREGDDCPEMVLGRDGDRFCDACSKRVESASARHSMRGGRYQGPGPEHEE